MYDIIDNEVRNVGTYLYLLTLCNCITLTKHIAKLSMASDIWDFYDYY